MPKLALAYGRQSVARNRDARDGGSVSIAYQREASEKWCASHDVNLVGWFADIDESGASTTREGMNALLEETKRIKPDFVIFWDIKRLSRNLRYFLEVFDIFQSVDAELVSCTEGTRHPAFVWKLLGLVGEEERDRIATSITHGVRESAKRGRHHGYAPIGYRLTESSELAINPDTRWIVEWIFVRALAGDNPTAISRRANAESIPTPSQVRGNGAAQWSPTTVRQILIRPVYAGLVEAGRKSRSRYGKSLPIVQAVGTHEPIIPLSDWQTVQESIAGTSRASAGRGSTHWLAGRVRCAACGSRLYYVDAGRIGKPYRDRYWRCAATYRRTFGQDRSVTCPAVKRRITNDVLTRTVREALASVMGRRYTVDQVIAHLDASGASQAHSMRQTHERELAALQKQRSRITDAIQFGAGDIAELAKRDRELIERMEIIAAELATVPPPVNPVALASSMATISSLAESIVEASDGVMATVAVELGLSVAVNVDTGAITLSYRPAYRWLS